MNKPHQEPIDTSCAIAELGKGDARSRITWLRKWHAGWFPHFRESVNGPEAVMTVLNFLFVAVPREMNMKNTRRTSDNCVKIP